MQGEKKIIPRKLSGFMELSPEKQIVFDNIQEKIKDVFNRNCFMPLDTPVLELAEILLAKSGGDLDKEIYHFDKGDTHIAMRYDLTVPLARFVAMNSETLSYPFKRYQIGKVYRGEKAQKGRFREFYQCDADIIGNEQLPVAADAECVNMLYEIFNKLNLEVVVNISNRNLLDGLIEEMGLTGQRNEILTALDKLDKIGEQNTKAMLQDLGLNDKNISALLNVCTLKGDSTKLLAKLSELSKNETYLKGVHELQELFTYLNAYGAKNCIINPGVIRGQNYYTGTIFEASMPSHPEFGAVGAGGRYDNLAQYFTDKKLPGVGMSIGLTRLFDLLDKNNMLPQEPKSNITLEIIPLGNTLPTCLGLATYFKEGGINTQVNYDERSFKAKLKAANTKQIPYVLIVGEDEVKNGTYALKDMLNGTQSTLSKEECLKTIKKDA